MPIKIINRSKVLFLIKLNRFDENNDLKRKIIINFVNIVHFLLK